jgi:two-component system sensor histidine kinase CpxA
LGGSQNLAARRVRSADGNILVLVAQMRPAPPGGGPLLDAIRPLRESPLPLLVLLGISGLVCYGLAAYLAAPAVKLRAATRRLASGDLTSRVGAQMGRRRDELADMGHDFDAMAERMEVLMLAERRLLGDISHELRSPLARLTVALDLAGENHDERTNSYLARIRRESERLNDMIGQLLALTRLESGATQARREPLDLAKLVAEVAADADFEAKSRARRVEAHTSPCTLNGHNGLLRSAVENVVRNAVRYTAEGSAVEISQCCDKSPQGAPAAIIKVRDHGPGVPEEALEKIFNPFYRVADARDRQSGGTGLGLAIAKRAVRYHAGTISAKNAVGGGLEVDIVLPLHVAADGV